MQMNSLSDVQKVLKMDDKNTPKNEDTTHQILSELATFELHTVLRLGNTW